MKSRTLSVWTKWLLIVGIYACIFSLINSEKVQAFSNIGVPSNEQVASRDESIMQLAKKPVELGIEYIKKMAMNHQTNTSAVIMFIGDLMCLGGQQNAANQGQEFDFQKSFTYVQPIFSSADMVVGNLETLISTSNPYTYKMKEVYGNPNCNAMSSYLDAIKYAGITAVVTANNHCLDGGVIGVQETIEQLDRSEIEHTGTFSQDGEQQFILCEVNGIKIAILSYTELINARSILPASQVARYISCYSKEKVEMDVQEAKKLGAEYIIAYNHWGTENTDVVTQSQQQHAREMAEAGVDLILGSHPHCLQRAEYIETTDSRSVLCVYSMGNFVSSMTKEINNDTIALKIALYKNKSGVYVITAGYYPMRVVPSYEDGYYVVLPISEDIEYDKKIENRLIQAKDRIQKVIGSQLSVIH